MTESLSNEQARKLVLHSQRLPPQRYSGSARSATLGVIEHLGYIQIDTISVIQRAHHHTLWNRNPRYKTSHLDQLMKDKQVFEYWSHAAAYLPMCDYRFSLYRKEEIARGDQTHWYRKDEGLMGEVLRRIGCEGPLMAKDFEHGDHRLGEWKSKPAKRALENLFMQGDLMVSSRRNFHKVYDLTERVVPDDIDRTPPTQEEYGRHCIRSYLRANGLGQKREIVYLLKNIKRLVEDGLQEMLLAGELQQIKVGGCNYYVLTESLELLQKPLSRSKLKILSPFDNLLIQRKRMQQLFDFEYLLECYLPAAKRQYGYFSLPILWDGRLVARMDCKAERKASILHIHHLALESGLHKRDAFYRAFTKELLGFMKFNECTDLKFHRMTPKDAREELLAVLAG